MAAALPLGSPGFRPANEVERRLALTHHDGSAYLRILRSALLYVPVNGTTRDGAPGRPPGWLHDGVPHLPVFTSIEALRSRTATIAEAYRVTDCDELVERWPDPRWRLAVNPGTPLGAYLPVTALRDLAAGRPDLVEFDPAWVFEPANPVERVMYLARDAGRPDRFLDALVIARAVMPTAGPATAERVGAGDFPWLVDIRGPEPVINVFTSVRRLASAGYPESQTVSLDFVAVAKAWPDRAFSLALNAGSAIATTFTGDQLPVLVEWARRLATRARAGTR